MDQVSNNTIEVKGVSIEFPGVKALQDVDCTFESGKAKALIGANGAGKSTLMKILAGANGTYTGEIIVNGKLEEIREPRKARTLGISIVYQEVDSVLIPNLSVAENIMIDDLVYDRKGLGYVNWKQLHQKSAKILEDMDIYINTTALVSSLTLAEKQMVLIARAMMQDCKFLILDEPTAPLSQKETEVLFELVKKLKKKGCGIIFISHRLNELFEICDDITVLKDGKKVADVVVSSDIGIDDIVKLMLGTGKMEEIDKSGRTFGKTILMTENLKDSGSRVHNINMEVKQGEIVGISGLVGAGKTELCKALFGDYGKVQGTYKVNDKKVNFASPGDAIKAGIALIPEERRKEGILVEESVSNNLSVVTINKYCIFGGILKKQAEIKSAVDKISNLLIKTPSPKQKVGLLSGGNQQKVTIGKWIDTNADVYIFDEPTKGIDVGAKNEIYKIIVDLARNGKSVIYTSSEQSEVLLLSDRMYVMYDGTIQKELVTDQTDEEEILYYATGGTDES